MKKSVLLLSFLMFIGVVVSVHAVEKMSSEKKEMKMNHSMSITGTIESLDQTNNTITIKTKKDKTDTFVVNDKTVVKKSGKNSSLMEASIGEKAKVTYKMEEDKMIATMIKLMPMPKEKKQ